MNIRRFTHNYDKDMQTLDFDVCEELNLRKIINID